MQMQCASVVVMSMDLGTTCPCSLLAWSGLRAFSFCNSLIIQEADISAHRMQRVNSMINPGRPVQQGLTVYI